MSYLVNFRFDVSVRHIGGLHPLIPKKKEL